MTEFLKQYFPDFSTDMFLKFPKEFLDEFLSIYLEDLLKSPQKILQSPDDFLKKSLLYFLNKYLEMALLEKCGFRNKGKKHAGECKKKFQYLKVKIKFC